MTQAAEVCTVSVHNEGCCLREPTGYRVSFSPGATDMVNRIRDLRIRSRIIEKLKGLSAYPEIQGKALTDGFGGLRRITVAGRYRAVYRVLQMRHEVRVMAVGIRRESSKDDVYRILAGMIRRGEVEYGDEADGDD